MAWRVLTGAHGVSRAPTDRTRYGKSLHVNMSEAAVLTLFDTSSKRLVRPRSEVPGKLCSLVSGLVRVGGIGWRTHEVRANSRSGVESKCCAVTSMNPCWGVAEISPADVCSAGS